jgi:hypothetical protein
MPQSGQSIGWAITVPLVVHFSLPPLLFEGKCPTSNYKQDTVPPFLKVKVKITQYHAMKAQKGC